MIWRCHTVLAWSTVALPSIPRIRKEPMANYTEHVPLKGSERVVVSGANAIGAANPDESLQVTVLLRSRAQAEDAKTRTTKSTASEKTAVESLLKQRSAERQHLTREQFLAQRGALEEDVQKAEEI